MHADGKPPVPTVYSKVRWVGLLLLVCVSAIALAACGSSGSSSSGSSSESEGESASGSKEAEGAGSSASANKKQAEEFTAKYEKPSAFPATEPLEKPVESGLKFAFMDCGDITCAVLKPIAEAAVSAAGGDFIDVKTGESASGVNAAFNSVISLKPDVILNAGADPALWRPALEQIKEAGIPVISTGVVQTSNYGLEEFPNTIMVGKNAGELFGKVEANYAYSVFGDGSSYVAPNLPAIASTLLTAETFESETERLCSDCSVSLMTIQPEEMGTTAPAKIVSELQSNPDTTAVVTASDPIVEGLPTSLQNAGLDQEIVGSIATPNTLAYVKEGKEKATIALDFPVLIWSMVDAGLRAAQGQQFSKTEAEGLPVYQLVTKENLNFDPEKGFNAYPEYEERFEEMWEGK
jgi:ribose transport system substrate-binding protein